MEFPEAIVLTILIETVVLLLALRNRYGTSVIIRNSIIANILTHPIIWFVMPGIGFSYPIQIAVSETFAFLAEALIFINIFRNMSIREALVISFLVNLASFSLGMIIS